MSFFYIFIFVYSQGRFLEKGLQVLKGFDVGYGNPASSTYGQGFFHFTFQPTSRKGRAVQLDLRGDKNLSPVYRGFAQLFPPAAR